MVDGDALAAQFGRNPAITVAATFERDASNTAAQLDLGLFAAGGQKAATETGAAHSCEIRRIDHIGIVVDDLAAVIEFFVELGLELKGRATVEGRWADRIVGLEGVRAEVAMLRTPDGHGRLEVSKFHAPAGPSGDPRAPANAPRIRHIAFVVEGIDAAVAGLRARGAELVGEVESYKDIYRLCYVAAPRGSSSS